jgi:uncharacterized protein YbjT (DUF2867 family)
MNSTVHDNGDKPNILVLGASGLIGRFVTDDLRACDLQVVGMARQFSPGQKSSPLDLELPILSLNVATLSDLLQHWRIDVVVNCLGVLQSAPGNDTRVVHHEFVVRLLQAMRDCGRSLELIHISIPGDDADDQTPFSRIKREAERLIEASEVRYAVLRPGFVIAPTAFGGSAMVRALAALPFDLPLAESMTPFQPVAVEDISATVAWLANNTTRSGRGVIWELMQPQPATLGDVIAEFRRVFGTVGGWRITLPAFLLDLGAKLGDLASLLGWSPPMRTTAIAELRRGVKGDPSAWMEATGIEPITLNEIGHRAASIQEKWFARLFLVKALIMVSLSIFWIASGSIALFLSYKAAAAILTSHQFSPALVAPITVVSSLMDISIGLLIAVRWTSVFGLIAGIVVSLGYLIGAAFLAPDLWLEPLGALVKTVPAIMLMLVALLMLDNR